MRASLVSLSLFAFSTAYAQFPAAPTPVVLIDNNVVAEEAPPSETLSSSPVKGKPCNLGDDLIAPSNTGTTFFSCTNGVWTLAEQQPEAVAEIAAVATPDFPLGEQETTAEKKKKKRGEIVFKGEFGYGGGWKWGKGRNGGGGGGATWEGKWVYGRPTQTAKII